MIRLSTIRNKAGVTLIELIVTMAIISVLAVGIIPLSQVSYKRTKEIELKRNLRIIRKALDEYKQISDEYKLAKSVSDSGYPKQLDVLVEGVELGGEIQSKKKILRRIPKDPMTEDGQWGLRSYFDEPDSDMWGGQDIYDIYTKSDQTALDGTLYREW
ncbi:type II secretion system protein [Desulfococcaceae bacterium HSG9]|nr:type II secretion system protein [Desulfococcaceae bacterium HSG9]